ncbi:MAG: hypothetical protein H6834_12655 [Planctomycetes bacterium]|nr:hypothetical protein [Planctomycetota bacterium]
MRSRQASERDVTPKATALFDPLLNDDGRGVEGPALHLAACPECRERGERLVSLVDLLSNLPRAQAPEGIAARAFASPTQVRGLEGLLRSMPRHRAPAPLDAHIEALVGSSLSQAASGDASAPGRVIPFRTRRSWVAVATAAALLLVLATLGSLLRPPSSGKTAWVGKRTGLRLEFESASSLESEDPEGREFLDMLAGWAAPPGGSIFDANVEARDR